MSVRKGILIPNNAGLVTTTAGPDLVHTLSTGRTLKIRKVFWYNGTGGLATIILGTRDRAAAPVFVPLFPTIACVNNQHDWVPGEGVVDVEFAVLAPATAAGLEGNVWVQASVAGILLRLSVEEFGR
jgi:hypothetical protein